MIGTGAAMVSRAGHADPVRLAAGRLEDGGPADLGPPDGWLDDLRSIGAVVGLALVAAGLAVAIASVLVHRSLVLPWDELAGRTSLWCAVVAALAGGALARGCRYARRHPRAGAAIRIEMPAGD